MGASQLPASPPRQLFDSAEVQGIRACAPSRVIAVLPRLMQALGKNTPNAGDEDLVRGSF